MAITKAHFVHITNELKPESDGVEAVFSTSLVSDENQCPTEICYQPKHIDKDEETNPFV